MIPWTCEHCDTTMSVSEKQIGTPQSCAKCGKISIVTDDFAVPSEIGLVQQHTRLLAAEEIQTAQLTSVVLIQLGMILMVIVGFLCVVVGAMSSPLHGLALMGSGMSMMSMGLIVWPVTIIANEVYRIRRHLDEQARRGTS